MRDPTLGCSLYTITEAARWLNVSRATMYRLLRSDAVKGVKVGGQWRIPVAELQKYVEDQINL